MTKEHKYEGGEIVPMGDYEVGDHYHIDYLYGHDLKMGWGYVIDVVSGDKFSVVDDDSEEGELVSFPTLKEAVAWCFERYKGRHPSEFIQPLWGAGAPNDTLVELGYEPPTIPKLEK